MEHPWTLEKTTSEKRLLQTVTNATSEAMNMDMNRELNSSFKKTLWMPSWDADQSVADS